MIRLNHICVRLLSRLFPCPFLHLRPSLQAARDALFRYTDGHGLTHLSVAGLKHICHDCMYYDPIEKYADTPDDAADGHPERERVAETVH